MTVRVLTKFLMAGAMTALLVPAVVSAQNAAAPKAKAPAAAAPKAAAPKAAASNEIPGKETPVMYGNFKPVKNFYGQPDLSGTWTNGSLTTMSRPATYNGRLVLTPQEVSQLEGDEQQNRIAGDAPTPDGFTVTDLPFSCGRGFTGVGCGYNGGFVDPGSTVTRVHGEPRSSWITYPATGTIPPARSSAPVASFQAAGEGADAAPAAAAGGRGGGGGRGAGGPPAGAAAGGRGGGGAARGPGGLDPNNDPERRGLAERCLTSFGTSAGPIMQPQLYNNDYRISQGKDSVAIWVEMVHDVRVVRLNDKHRTDGIRPWWGDAIGHYEGNTLVVETTNYNPQNRISGRSAEDLVLTERFTRVSPVRLLYQFNVHSPANWDQDWGGEYEFAASPGIYEYACHEGNYALGDILAGNLDALKAATAPRAAR